MEKRSFIIKEKEFSHVAKLISVGNSKGVVLRKEDLETIGLEVGDSIKLFWKPVKKDEVQSETQ